MPYYTHTLVHVDISERCPIGVDVIKNEHATLAGAEAAPDATGDIFCDEITLGRTIIRTADGVWVNDYANPARA